MMNANKVLKHLSAILFLESLYIYPLWFKLHFQITPKIIIGKALIVNVIVIILTVTLIIRKPSNFKRFIILNVLTITVVTFLTYALPVMGISNFTKNAIVDYYELTDVSGGGGGIPADWIRLKDNDATVDVQEDLKFYGSNKIKYLQGVISKEGELKGKKVVIVFQGNIFDPISTIIVYELDSSFDTTKREIDQGYKEDRYPIIDIVVSPE